MKEQFNKILKEINVKLNPRWTLEIKKYFDIDDEKIRQDIIFCDIWVRSKLKKDELNYGSYPDHQYDGDLDELMLSSGEKYVIWGADKAGFGKESETEFIDWGLNLGFEAKEYLIENSYEYRKKFLKEVNIDYDYFIEKSKKIRRRWRKFKEINRERERNKDSIFKRILSCPPEVFFSRDRKLAIIIHGGYFQCVGEYNRVIKAFHYFRQYCYEEGMVFGGWW